MRHPVRYSIGAWSTPWLKCSTKTLREPARVVRDFLFRHSAACATMEPEPHSLPPPPRGLLDGSSLFLDFDGTLVEIAARHNAVTVEADLRRLIERLREKLDGRIAVVSGRSLENIRNLLAVPTLAMGGSHGLELQWSDGRLWTAPDVKRPDELPSRLETLKERHPALLIEQKPFGVAIHYRLAPEAENECREFAASLARESGWLVQPGKMVVELKSTAANKGSAVDAFMSEPPMIGTRPIFVGDDETDEAGFVAVARRSGAGVLVGAARPTAAAYRLGSVDQTLKWLNIACEDVR